MYSDMSMRIMVSSSPNRNSARVRASSVLPTPDGPRKMNEPVGRLGSLSPARERRIALETTSIAGCWPITRLCSSSSIRISFAVSASVSLNTGIPVHIDTMSAISSSPIAGRSAVAQALENLDRLLGRGLVDRDLLEAALERGVALQILAVLLERGGADRLKLAACKRRLQDRGGVDRAFGCTSADEVVELVDEQDDVAALGDLLHHLLQALLKFSPVLRARN